MDGRQPTSRSRATASRSALFRASSASISSLFWRIAHCDVSWYARRSASAGGGVNQPGEAQRRAAHRAGRSAAAARPGRCPRSCSRRRPFLYGDSLRRIIWTQGGCLPADSELQSRISRPGSTRQVNTNIHHARPYDSEFKTKYITK